MTGSDASVYPHEHPAGAAGIDLMEGYLPSTSYDAPDCVVVGNAATRGNPAMEYLLNSGLPIPPAPSGWPRTLARQVGAGRAGHSRQDQHQQPAGLDTGLRGHGAGLPDRGCRPIQGKRRAAESDFFVVEPTEYDTAFSTSAQVRALPPRTLAINNLEFDHADIFADLAAIQRQFHHLVRCVPGDGLIMRPAQQRYRRDPADGLLDADSTFGPSAQDGAATWRAQLLAQDGSRHFRLQHDGQQASEVSWRQVRPAQWKTPWRPWPPPGTSGLRRRSRRPPWLNSAGSSAARNCWAGSTALPCATILPTIPPRSPPPCRACGRAPAVGASSP